MDSRILYTISRIGYAVLLLAVATANRAGAADQYNFTHVDSRDGLSANNVKSIVQDSLGFMWFGTKNGLNRYDGSTFRVYKCYDEERKCGNNNIGALYEDENTTLWIGTDRGIYQYDPREDRIRFVDLKPEDGMMPDNWVQAIAGDGKGHVWALLPDEGLYLYDTGNGTVRHFRFEETSKFKKVYASDVMVGSDGSVWVAIANDGLYRYHPSTGNFVKERIKNPDMVTDTYFMALCETAQGTVIAGTTNGSIYEYNPRTHVVNPIAFSGRGNVYLRDILCFDNELWIGTHDGLYIKNLDNGAERFLKENPLDPFSLSDNTVYCIYRDKSGGAWIGSIFGGVSYMSRRKFKFANYGIKDGLTGRLVLGVTADRSNRIWTGTETAGLNLLNPVDGKFTSPFHISGVNRIVLSMTSINGNIYPSFSRAGLYCLNPDNNSHHKVFPLNEGDDSNVYSYIVDRDGDEWVGTSFALYCRKKGDTDFKHITETGYDWIYCLFESSDGSIWMGTMGNGIWRHNKKNGSFQVYTYDQNSSNQSGLMSNSINSIMEDSEGRLWISTDRGGLSRYDKKNDRFVTYGIEKGLPDDVVYGVVEDRGKNLWFGTNKGLVRFNPDNSSIRVFTRHDGLPFEQFNYKSAIYSPDGNIYMGGINGLISFNPEDYKDLNTPLNIYFTGLWVRNQELRPGQDSHLKENILFAEKLTLPHEDATFSLSIAAPEFRHLGPIALSYRLLPVSDKWVELKDNEISFVNLAPGKYTLEVKAESESNLATRKIEIKILPPWWKSWWAYGIDILLVLLLAGLWFLWYRSHKEKQMRVHEQMMMDNKDKELYRSKVNFFTEIAHEIRTPLSLIDLPLEAMEELDINDPQFKEYLSVTRKNTGRLLELTGQILDFQKIDSSRLTLKKESVDIPALLNDIADRFDTPLKLAGKTLERHIAPDRLMVMTDREALVKMVSNLLNNARKYGDRIVELSLHRKGDEFEILVASDGEKIKPEERDRIFMAFYQTHSGEDSKSGVGIGLPLSRSLATLMGGSLTLEDNPDDKDRNVFKLTLPVIAPKDDSEPVDSEIDDYMLTSESNQSKPRQDVFSILLVEDNETILKFLADQLSRSFMVSTAGNGVEALEKLKTMQPDLILTDIMMPEMDGMELCRLVKSDVSLSHIPLVFITAKNDLDSKILGLQCGAEAYVEKPFSIKYLRNLINSILDNRRREREAVNKNPFMSSEGAQVSGADRELMEKIKAVIDKHISDENFNVDSLCDELNMSRSAVLRKIKSLFGMSPIEVIRTIKLKRATELIKDGRYRISDICYMVGIATPSYFSKLFFRQYGMTPKDFEKQCRVKGKDTENSDISGS